MAIVADAEVDDVERRLADRLGIGRSGPAQRCVGHRHQVHVAAWNRHVAQEMPVELFGIAVGIPVGGHPLVDLEQIHVLPRQTHRDQRVEHQRGGAPPAYCDPGNAAQSDRGADPPGDPPSCQRCGLFGVGGDDDLHDRSADVPVAAHRPTIEHRLGGPYCGWPWVTTSTSIKPTAS